MNLVKELRARAGMQQKEIALMAGVSRPTVSEWEHQKKDPSGERLIKLAKLFGVSTGVILGYDPIPGNVPQTAEAPTGADTSPYIVDHEAPAMKAMETLIKHRVTVMPVLPMSILQAMPNVLLVSFTEMADKSGVDRNSMAALFGAQSQDVIGYYSGGVYYVAYNQRLPYYMLQRAMARELGHIMLRHNDADIPDDAKTKEALYFSRYLLCPRPLLKMLFDEDIPISVETLGNITGLYGRSLAGIRETTGAHVPARMNQIIRAQFAGYVHSIADYMRSMVADNIITQQHFGTFMDNYEE